MRKLYLGGVVAMSVFAAGCSGSSSDQAKATVDPASEDFCLHWANDVCRLAYQCVGAQAQDGAFHTRYGKSSDDCWQSVEKYCTSNQSGSQTFGPSCGPGKKVNSNAASACTDGLESTACAAWTVAPAGACDGVCSTASNTGAGGAGGGSPGAGGMSSGGAGTSSGGAGTSSGSVATTTEFCNTEFGAECDRTFECDPTKGATQFGTLAGCHAAVAALCASENPCPASYDASLGAGCVAATKTATCEQLMGDAPAICTSACQ